MEDIKTCIRRRHLERLKKSPLLRCSLAKTNLVVPNKPSYFSWMEEWSQKANVQIAAAIATKVTGGSNIDWNIGLYTFMESAAMYLRDWPSIFLAAKAAKDGHDDTAMGHLVNSDAEIQKIASMWDPSMQYITICDLLEDSPDSDPTLDGPFCGAFFSSDPNVPFIGIVFKGTHIESWAEMLVDLHYSPMQATEGHLWGTHVSEGVFMTMFGPFHRLGEQTPFAYIKEVICLIASNMPRDPTSPPIDVHVTGHSLGASYASLCYAELLRLYNNQPIDPFVTSPSKLILRDLYTFGSPRFALEDFVDVFMLVMDTHHGYSWRIVSEGDPVTLVPPVHLIDPKFIHLDKAWQVSENAEFQELPSERNSHPRPPIPVINMSYHTPWAYFNALYRAATP